MAKPNTAEYPRLLGVDVFTLTLHCDGTLARARCECDRTRATFIKLY